MFSSRAHTLKMPNDPKMQFGDHFIIIEFYIYKSNLFWFSEIPARAAVRAVLLIWTRELVRTCIKNGKWPQNAIPTPLYTIKFYIYKSKFSWFSEIPARAATRAVLSIWTRERVRTRIENGKGPQNAITRPLYIIEFHIYKSKFFGFSKIPAPAAVRAVLSICTRERVRTRIENGKWPRNAIPRALCYTKILRL